MKKLALLERRMSSADVAPMNVDHSQASNNSNSNASGLGLQFNTTVGASDLKGPAIAPMAIALDENNENANKREREAREEQDKVASDNSRSILIEGARDNMASQGEPSPKLQKIEGNLPSPSLPRRDRR